MDIKPAQEQDIIDVLYLLKQEKELACEPHPENPIREYSTLKDNISQGRVYLLAHHKISIGTFSMDFPGEESTGRQGDATLQINRITIASYWINNETLAEILDFLEDYARQQGFTRIHFLINSCNSKLNNFYNDLGFSFLGRTSSPDTHTPCNVYEKEVSGFS